MNLNEETLKKIERQFIGSYKDKLSFRTFDIAYGIPQYFLDDVKTIYQYCKYKNITNPLILRPGNGTGKDLLIKNYFLKNLDIYPLYYLIDYDQNISNKSLELNPEIPKENYILHDLLHPLNSVKILKNMFGKVDIIDCRQILHEVFSKNCGGSSVVHRKLLRDMNWLLKQEGLLLIYDGNIVGEKADRKITFKLTQLYEKYLKKFISILNLKYEFSKKEKLIWTTSLRWFSIFYYKSDYFNQDMTYDKRELAEIHRKLSIHDWLVLLEKCGYTVDKIDCLDSLKITQKISKNIIHDLVGEDISFAVHIVAEKINKMIFLLIFVIFCC